MEDLDGQQIGEAVNAFSNVTPSSCKIRFVFFITKGEPSVTSKSSVNTKIIFGRGGPVKDWRFSFRPCIEIQDIKANKNAVNKVLLHLIIFAKNELIYL